MGFSYYNILSGILRGLGDSLSALVFLIISTALNVVLDIWFVASFNMGVPELLLQQCWPRPFQLFSVLLS